MAWQIMVAVGVVVPVLLIPPVLVVIAKLRGH